MKVLLGIGGGEDADRALERTVARAAETGDELVVAVVDDPEAPADPAAVAGQAAARIREADLDAEVRRVDGDPGSQLVEIAESEGFDELVIGGGRESPMGKIRLGPIAEFVVMNATVSVTLVR